MASPSSWEYASGRALLAALLPSPDRGSVKLHDLASIVFFGAPTFAVSAVLGVIAQQVDSGTAWLDWMPARAASPSQPPVGSSS